MSRLCRAVVLLTIFLTSLLFGRCSQKEGDQSEVTGPAVVGTWVRMIPGSQEFELTLRADHTYGIDLNRDADIDVSGEYSLSNGQIIFVDTGGERSCPGKEGIYVYRLEEYLLSFSLVEDKCGGRFQILHGDWVVKNYTEAIEEYTRAIALDSANGSAYFRRGEIKVAVEDFAGAISDFDKAIELNPNHAQAYEKRAFARVMGSRDYQGGLIDYNKAIELDPGLERAYFNRGQIKHYLKDKEGACADWQTSYELGFNRAEEIIEFHCRSENKEKLPRGQKK